jgi:hypothetical protein
MVLNDCSRRPAALDRRGTHENERELSPPACISDKAFGDVRSVPSCRNKHNQDCEREPCARTHNSVLHTHAIIAPAEENSLIGVQFHPLS